MPFRFFRPWEDGGMANAHQTPVGQPGALAEEPGAQSAQQCDPGVDLQSDRDASFSLKKDMQRNLSAPEVSVSLSSEKESYAQTYDLKTHSLQNPKISVFAACNPSMEAYCLGDKPAEKRLEDCNVRKECLSSHLCNVTPTSSCLLSADASENVPTQFVIHPQGFSTLISPSSVGCLSPHSRNFVADKEHCADSVNDMENMKVYKVPTMQSLRMGNLSSAKQLDTNTECRLLNYEDTEQDSPVQSTSNMQECNEMTKLSQSTICKKACSTSNNLCRHKRTHTGSKPFKYAVHKKTLSECSNLQRHEQTHKGSKLFKCAVCEKAFTQSGTLNRHKQTHTCSKRFKCRVCEKAFTRSYNVRQHERTHTGIKPFQCAVCEKAFTRSYCLRQHEQTHTSIKPFQCAICEKAFSSSNKLGEHERVHTGERPFQCDVCKKTFIKASNLHYHERIHTEVKPFKCTVCQKAFRRSGTLHMHERTHTGSKPFQCKICQKAFTQFSTLHVHERTHKGVKPFKCAVCQKTFRHANTLCKHERTHTGAKPYKCAVCQKTFRQSSNWNRHMRTHTRAKSLK